MVQPPEHPTPINPPPTPTRSITSRISLFVLFVVLLSGTFVHGASASSAGFSNVTGQGGIMSVAAWGKYIGPGPITLTVGTGSNVLGTKVAQVSIPKSAADGGFYVQATGLNAGTNYHIRLDSPTASYTSPTTFKTKTRKVVVDYDRVDVHNDADAFPRGCGDFRFSFSENKSQPITTANAYCLNGGETGYIDDLYGRWVGNDVKSKTIDDRVYAFDDDVACLAGSSCYAGCDSMFTMYTACGDFGYGHRSLDVTKAGTRPLFFSVTGTDNPMWVIFVGTLTVSYS